MIKSQLRALCSTRRVRRFEIKINFKCRSKCTSEDHLLVQITSLSCEDSARTSDLSCVATSQRGGMHFLNGHSVHNYVNATCRLFRSRFRKWPLQAQHFQHKNPRGPRMKRRRTARERPCRGCNCLAKRMVHYNPRASVMHGTAVCKYARARHSCDA